MFSYKDSFENIDVINLITTHVATEGYCRITSILDLTEVQQYLDSINQIDAIELKREHEGARDQDYDYNYYSFSGTHYYNSPRRFRVFDHLLGHPFVINLLEEIMGYPCILSQTELRRPAHKKDDDYANGFFTNKLNEHHYKSLQQVQFG